MKSVLISIQPKWCELIASGKKTIEVRKTRPKIDGAFKCYIYCTKENIDIQHKKIWWHKDSTGYAHIMNGKAIGEFVCDYTTYMQNPFTGEIYPDILIASFLTQKEADTYANGRTLYGWHISDLKIYDKPKELSEFALCKPKYQLIDKNDYISRYREVTHLRKAPQSWQYIESEENQ